MKRPAIFLFIVFFYLSSCGLSKNTAIDRYEATRSQIMFTSNRDKNYEVYVMNDDSTGLKNLTNHSATDYGLNWSPNGKYILFYSNRTGNEEIWRMNSDGTNLINLTDAASNERGACYSPNGQNIVFTSDRDNKTSDLYLMNADGSNTKRLTFDKGYCESATWTIDGQQILFTFFVEDDVNNKKASGELFIINADGSNRKRLTNKEGYDSGAAISPNGKKIAFYGKSESGNTDIFIMNINGTGITNLTNDKLEDYSPSWSPDGNWLAYTSGNSANYDVWKTNIYSKQKVRLTSHVKRDETPYYKPRK